MKNQIINQIIRLGYKIDQRRNKLTTYDYETAPYCGHHFSGVNGSLYNASYHEGEGGECVKFLGFTFYSVTDNTYSWNWRCPYQLKFHFTLKHRKSGQTIWSDTKLSALPLCYGRGLVSMVKLWCLCLRKSNLKLRCECRLHKV